MAKNGDISISLAWAKVLFPQPLFVKSKGRVAKVSDFGGGTRGLIQALAWLKIITSLLSVLPC